MILKPLTDRRWNGYTLDEIQEQLALTDARIMMRKRALGRTLKTAVSADAITSATGPVAKISGLLNLIVAAVMLVRRVAPVVSRLFRRKQR